MFGSFVRMFIAIIALVLSFANTLTGGAFVKLYWFIVTIYWAFMTIEFHRAVKEIMKVLNNHDNRIGSEEFKD